MCVAAAKSTMKSIIRDPQMWMSKVQFSLAIIVTFLLPVYIQSIWIIYLIINQAPLFRFWHTLALFLLLTMPCQSSSASSLPEHHPTVGGLGRQGLTEWDPGRDGLSNGWNNMPGRQCLFTVTCQLCSVYCCAGGLQCVSAMEMSLAWHTSDKLGPPGPWCPVRDWVAQWALVRAWQHPT